MSDGGNGSSAKPLYHYFIEQAQKLNPKYLIMIIPARWFSGGKGLDNFREKMINDKRIKVLEDYFDATECFPGIDLSGGVCYFLWDRDYHGECRVISHFNGKTSEKIRPLLEKGHSSFIRFNEAVSNSPNDHVLKGVFDFGNADISNRSFDFIKLININRGLGRNIINQYNEISPHKVSQKEADYQYLCWQAQNLIIYDTALKNINKDKQSNQISSQKYDEFMARYNKFERLTSDKLASFRIDVARERSENRRNKDIHELSSKDHTAEKAPFKKDMIKDRTTFIKNIISEKNYQK